VRRFAPQVRLSLFVFCLLLFFASTSHGQIPIAPGNGRQDIQNREWALTNLRREVNHTYERERKVLQLTVREDFRKLQLVNNDLMKRTFLQPSETEISLKEIRSSLGEIRKVAQRLKVNLTLPKVESQKNSDSAMGLYRGLIVLDKTVMRFVENPFFQQPKVLDAESSIQARKDLDEILRLTDFLKKLAKDQDKSD
jgi:hypothetical protein